MKKLKVGVLMGGKSIEREASFNSGRTVCDHLDQTLYDVIPLFQTSQGELYLLPWRFLHRGKTTDFEHRLAQEAQKVRWDDLPHFIDFAYITMHGRYAEDGTLQGMLEILHIPYLGSQVLASALTMNKSMQKGLLRMQGIMVAPDIQLSAQQCATLTLQEIKKMLSAAAITVPCIVKPQQEGSSLGVQVIFEETGLVSAVQHASTIDPDYPQTVLVEPKLEGMEFSAIVMSDAQGNFMCLPPTEIIPDAASHFFDYEQKYMPGRATKHTPARCAAHLLETIKETCKKVMHIFDMRTLARIDGFLLKNDAIVIIDVNSIAGMAPTSFTFRQAAEIGMNHAQLINHLIHSQLVEEGKTHS